MNRSMLPLLMATAVIVLGAGCSGTAGPAAPTAAPRHTPATNNISPLETPRPASATTPPQGQSIIDDTSLIAALRAAGAKVESGDEVEQPFFTVPGKVIRVNDQEAHPVIFTTVLVAVLFLDKSAKYDWTMRHVAA